MPTVRVNWQTGHNWFALTWLARDTNMSSCTFGIKETTSKWRCLSLATYSAVRRHTRYPTNSRIDTLQHCFMKIQFTQYLSASAKVGRLNTEKYARLNQAFFWPMNFNRIMSTPTSTSQVPHCPCIIQKQAPPISSPTTHSP